jgi:5-methylcytosine-specific restriction protein A
MSLRHNDSKHGTPRTRGRTWQRIRLQVLAEEPLCRACQAADRVTAAAEVDHIKPLHHGGTDERSNLQPLCAECHEQKTRAELGYEEREVVGLDGWPVQAGAGGARPLTSAGRR